MLFSLSVVGNLKAKHLVQELTISKRTYEFAVCLGLDFTDILVFVVLQRSTFFTVSRLDPCASAFL